jgi:predicted Na+-dependent transporter
MILRVLAFLGRHGTGMLAGGLFIGLVLPPLATLLRSWLTPLVFLITTATLLGIEWRAVLGHLRRPGRLALVLGWSLLATPVLCDAASRLAGLPDGLAQAIVLWSASAPLTSTPAIALLLGLDPALALVAVVGGTFLMPFTLPPLVLGLIGLELGIGVVPLMVHLVIFVGGAALAAALVYRLVGVEALRRRAIELSGLNVLFLILFAVSIMDGMQAMLLASPARVLLYVAVAMAASVLLQGLSFLAFCWMDRRAALTVGLFGGNRNMALTWANLGPVTSPELALFFVTVQAPIYLLPALLQPLYRRLSRASP